MLKDPTRERLAAEITRDFNQMVESGQINAEPLPVRESDTPATEPQPAPTEPKVADKQEAQPAKDEPLLAGKYKDVDALVQGYNNLLGQSTKISTENQTYREQLNSMIRGRPEGMDANTHIPGGSPGADPRIDPLGRTPDWKTNAAVMKFSENTGLDPDVPAALAASIYDSVTQDIQRISAEAAQKALAPIYAQSQAEMYIQQKHPEASKLAPEIKLFLETADPVVQGTFKNLVDANNYAGAGDYAYLAFRQASGGQAQSDLQAQAKTTEHEQAQAKANAGLAPSSPGTPIHDNTTKDDAPSNEAILKLAERARNGDIHDQKAYRDATVGRMLKGDPNFQKMLARHNAEMGS